MKLSPFTEICINAATSAEVQQDVRAAYNGGASTIELCGDMSADGVTPNFDLVQTARAAFGSRPGLMVMIRPRAGDFCYSSVEVTQMQHDIELAARSGADGVVFGGIRSSDQHLDITTMTRLITVAHACCLSVTLHRAFDATPNPLESLETAIQLGVQRILTSGTPWGSGQTALDGIDIITQLIEQANRRVKIVIGGGVRPANIRQIVRQLPQDVSHVGLHAYSGVLQNGRVSAEAVAALRADYHT